MQIAPEKAAKVALIINELATNSIKHGFPDNRAGRIWIAGRQIADGWYEIVCQDDGIGHSGPTRDSKGLGLKIINASASNIRGSIVWSNSSAGFGLTLTFPVDG